jgi:hypothetical protein
LDYRIQNKNVVLYLLIGLAVGLLVFRIGTTRLYTVDPMGLGLASSLPIAFWVGLAALGLLWFFSIKTNWALGVALVLTVGYLFLAPAVIRDPVWLSSSYYPFGESSLVNSSGHLVDRAGQALNSYHNWPLFIYLSSIITQSTAISTTLLLKYFPIFIISLCAILSYFILRMKFAVPHAILGVGIFVASFWFRQQYFGPPGFGYVLFLLALLIVLKYSFSEIPNKPALAGLFFLVFGATMFTHFLTAVMSLTVVVVLFLSLNFAHVKNHLNVVPLILGAGMLFLAYNLFFSPGFFSYLIRTFSNLISFQSGLLQESTRIAGSAAQILNYRSTLAIVALDCSLPLVGILWMARKKISRSSFFGDGFKVFWFVLLFVLIIFAVFFQYGPHEGYQRALMFALLPLSYLSVLAVVKKPRVLVIVIVALLFLNIPAQYGGDSYTLETKTDLSGAQFLATKTADGVAVLYDFSLLQRYFDPAKNVSFRTIENLPFTYIPNSTVVLNVASQCDYVVLSNTSDSYFYYFMQHTPVSDALNGSNDSLGFSRVYDSKGFVVFSDK